MDATYYLNLLEPELTRLDKKKLFFRDQGGGNRLEVILMHLSNFLEEQNEQIQWRIPAQNGTREPSRELKNQKFFIENKKNTPPAFSGPHLHRTHCIKGNHTSEIIPKDVHLYCYTTRSLKRFILNKKISHFRHLHM